MRKSILFAALFITALISISNAQTPQNFAPSAKQEELPAGSEAAKALARLGDLTRPALRERLKQMQQPDYPPNQLLVDKIIAAQRLPVAYSKGVDQLKAALQPVLAYHGRSQTPIYVLHSNQPKAYLVEQAVIIITTRMMLSAAKEELRGILAHELAHDYIWAERVRAKLEKDGKLLRECELFCDAVAAFTLKELGDDPASYGRVLERLVIIGSHTGSTMMGESTTHPSLETRQKLNKFLCQRLD